MDKKTQEKEIAEIASTKDYTVTTLPQSKIELKGQIPWERLAAFEAEAFAKLAAQVELKGFRKGNVPDDIARKQIPDEILLADMAELAINHVYPTILASLSLQR
jgi:FKBP-type peptidyl-prolyl cis-trans isomerase (trigger factor)